MLCAYAAAAVAEAAKEKRIEIAGDENKFSS
jgi:hypothetical protein